MDELQLAKDCEAAIRKRLRAQAKRELEQVEKQKMLLEVADLFQSGHS